MAELAIETDRTDSPIKLKLSVTLLAKYLRKGVSQAKIAEICGVTKQSVNGYIDRHIEDLEPLMDTDESMSLGMKRIALAAGKRIQAVLDTDDPYTKKDLVPLSTVMGIATDKYRVLSEQSTGIQVVRIESNVTRPVIDLPSSMVNEIVTP